MRTTVTAYAEIDLEDYVDEIDFDTLLDECLRRTAKNKSQKEKVMQILSELNLGVEDVLELFKISKNLTLDKEAKLKDFIKTEILT